MPKSKEKIRKLGVRKFNKHSIEVPEGRTKKNKEKNVKQFQERFPRTDRPKPLD